jgi:hypothetical protein
MLAALCLTTPVPAGAEVYKWVDERGVVNYGDTPPQKSRGVMALDLQSGVETVIPGITREELERLRERDSERRLRQLEAEVEELRARDAARSAASAASASEPRYSSYPVYWYGRTLPGRGGIGREHRPAHPIAKPWPRDPELMPGKQSLKASGPAAAPSRRPPIAGQPSEMLWKR